MNKHYTPQEMQSILERDKDRVLDTYEPEPIWPYLLAGLSLLFGVVELVS